jgi:hypothetical protein
MGAPERKKDSSFLKKRSKKLLFVGPGLSTRRAQRDKSSLLLSFKKEGPAQRQSKRLFFF